MLKRLLLATTCLLSISATYAADSISITESATDKLLTYKYKEEGETFTEYSLETTGKFSITAKISGDAFNEAGLYWEDITQDTPASISIGNFAFSDALNNTDKPALTETKLNAVWTEKEDVCDSNSEKCKSITTQKITVTAAKNSNVVTIKANGSSKFTDGDGYGSNVFSTTCLENGNGVVPDAIASITINDITLSTPLKVTCSVRSKNVTKPDDEFTLNTIKVTGKKL
jgi:hypothetical protein